MFLGEWKWEGLYSGFFRSSLKLFRKSIMALHGEGCCGIPKKRVGKARKGREMEGKGSEGKGRLAGRKEGSKKERKD